MKLSMVSSMIWESDPLQPKRRSVPVRYLLAVLFVVLGWAVREMATRVGKDLPLIGMPFAVFFAAYVGGIGPGLLATGLAVLFTALVVPPTWSLHVSNYVDQVRLISFSGLGILISLLSERAHRLQMRAAANELALSESRYLTVIYQSVEPILVLKDGVIRVLNTSMVALLGPIRRQGLLNEPLVDFVHPDDRELVKLWLADLRPGLTRSPSRLRFVRLDGQIVEAVVSLEVFAAGGAPSVQVTLSEARSVLLPGTEPPTGMTDRGPALIDSKD